MNFFVLPLACIPCGLWVLLCENTVVAHKVVSHFFLSLFIFLILVLAINWYFNYLSCVNYCRGMGSCREIVPREMQGCLKHGHAYLWLVRE